MIVYKENKKACVGAALTIFALFIIFINSRHLQQDNVQHYAFPEYSITGTAPVEYYDFPELYIYPSN